MAYTIGVNQNEYMVGVYGSYDEAKADVLAMMKEDGYWDVPEDLTVEEFDPYEYDPDGDYSITELAVGDIPVFTVYSYEDGEVKDVFATRKEVEGWVEENREGNEDDVFIEEFSLRI